MLSKKYNNLLITKTMSNTMEKKETIKDLSTSLIEDFKLNLRGEIV